MKANISTIHRIKTVSLASLVGTLLFVSHADAGGITRGPSARSGAASASTGNEIAK